MAGSTPIYGFPYPESSDLVANYPALGQDLAEDIESVLSAGLGKILQVVRATDTTDRSTTNTTAFVDASISVTITPTKNTSNIILIWSFDATGSSARTAAFQITDSANVGVSGAQNADHTFDTGYEAHIVLIGYASPATTSAVTYKGRFKSGATNTLTLQNATGTGQLFAIEVAA